MADPGVPIFRGGSGSDCEEFIRAIYAYAFERDKAKDDEWIATYAATRLSGKALRWYAQQDKAVKLDWSALQIALLNQYPPSDDDEDEEDAAIGPRAQPRRLPSNIPTPAAAGAPSVGVPTTAAPAPAPPVVQPITVSGCKKAKIRVEDMNGTAKGWVSMTFTSGSDWTTNLSDSLQVKAERVDSGPTTLRILNVYGWYQLGIIWSDPDSPFDERSSHHSGRLNPCNESGHTIFRTIQEALSGGECLSMVWDINNAGIITPTWQKAGGRVPLQGRGSVFDNSLCFCSTRSSPSPPALGDFSVKLVYEPFE